MSYNPSVGRWMQEDPDGYINGPNMYQFEESNVIDMVDPTGLAGATTQPTSQPSQPKMTPSQTPPPPTKPKFDSNGMTDKGVSIPLTLDGALTPADSPAQELANLLFIGNKFAKDDSMYIPYSNDCVNQSLNLQAYLASKLGDKNGNLQFWILRTEQRNNGGSYHNVVVLDPKPGNPMASQVLDSFHWWFTFERKCKVESYADFKKEFPQQGK